MYANYIIKFTAEEFVNSSLKLETLLESLPEEGLEEEEMEGSECTSPCADGPLLERVARVAREKENGGGTPSSPTRSNNHEDGASKDVIGNVDYSLLVESKKSLFD